MEEALRIARQRLIAADDARYEALMASDVEALDGLLTDDFIYTHNAGYSDDKAAYLERIRSGVVYYSDWNRLSANVRLFGSVGMMTGHMRMVANLADRAVQLDNLYLAVWIWRDLGWRLTAWSSTSRGTPEGS